MTRPHLLSFTGEVKHHALHMRELHAASTAEALNEEWLLLENAGANSISVRGCTLTVAVNAQRRPQTVATIEAGFVLGAGEKIRLVTGSPAKRAQGTPPSDDVPNYHLFLKEPLLTQPGLVVRLMNKQLELALGVFGAE
jgi:hypothetical protein